MKMIHRFILTLFWGVFAFAPLAAAASWEVVTMPRPFTFNVPGEAKDRLYQVRVSILTTTENAPTVRTHIPLYETSMLKYFSTWTADKHYQIDTVKIELKNAIPEFVRGGIEEIVITGIVAH